MNLRMLRIILSVVFALALAAEFSEHALGASTNVTASGFSFLPAAVTIKAGDSVIWSGLEPGNS